MILEQLENLVKIKKLKAEPPDQDEFDGMVSSAMRRLQDAAIEGLSDEGRFSLHTAPLMRLHWHRCVGTDTGLKIAI